MQRHLTCFGLLVVACASSAYADNYDGYFDSGFATGGREQIDVSPGSYDLGRVLRIQPDGKLLV